MTKRTVTPGVFYMEDIGFAFGYLKIVFTMDEEAFRKETLALGIDAEMTVLPDGCSAAVAKVHDKKGKPYAFIGMKPSFHKPLAHDIGVITHECVHVKQIVCEVLGEEEPGKEYEAYVVEAVTVFCVEHYLRARQRHDEMVVKQRPARRPSAK